MPLTPDQDTDRKQRIYTNARRVLQAIIEKPSTVKELAVKLHTNDTTVAQAIRFWYDNKLIHVHSYRGKTSRAKVWAIGEGVDAEVPPIKTPAQKCKEWRAKGNDAHRARRLKKPVLPQVWGSVLCP